MPYLKYFAFVPGEGSEEERQIWNIKQWCKCNFNVSHCIEYTYNLMFVDVFRTTKCLECSDTKLLKCKQSFYGLSTFSNLAM